MGPGAQPSANNLFTGNVVAEGSSEAIAAVNLGDSSVAQWTNNFYASSNLGSRDFAAMVNGKVQFQSLSAWEAVGYDAGSATGDPLFVDPSNGNYLLQPGSPALSLGIVNPPIDQAGLAGYVPSSSGVGAS
jgi:hypothetical protein